MFPAVADNTEKRFSPSMVFEQAEKIFRHPRFSGCGILKRFLQFVLQEGINGRAHLVKEYSVAVSVLNKPINFNPRENGIVRIHAARLRKLLAEYYAGPGRSDDIRILLPKGHYVPIIIDNNRPDSNPDQSLRGKSMGDHPSRRASGTVGVFPFHTQGRDEGVLAFADGLGLSLSTNLMKIRSLHVISYSIMRMMPGRLTSAEDWGLTVEPQFMIMGDVQRQKETVRITVQLVRASTGEQLWCHVYERNVVDGDMLSIQDQVAEQVIRAVRKLGVISGSTGKTHFLTIVP